MFSLSMNFLPAASTAADKFESFFTAYLWIGVSLFVLTLGAGIFWAIKYRRKHEDDETPYIPHNYLVEFLSVFFISIWAAAFFIWGWRDYVDTITPKMDEYEVNVIGQQWNWQIQYSFGKTYTNELYIPRGRPIKLIMTSKDVLHSFFIPEFRVKTDLVPGQFTTMHFTATKAGVYNIFCAEFCGTSHSQMLGKVYVLEAEDFQKFTDGILKKPESHPGLAYAATTGMPLADKGALLYKAKACNTCHSVNGSRLYGPSFKGLYGSQVELVGGKSVTVDENFIRESIMDPMAKIAKDFPPTMPTFRGMLSDEEVNQLIAFMKTLK